MLRRIRFFLAFALGHGSWVLVLTCTHGLFLWSEIKKGSTGFHLKIIVFTAVKNCSTFRGRFCCDPILWKGDNLKTFKVEDYKNVIIITFFFS